MALAFSTGAFAQVDEDFLESDAMEVQRCIWRCQAEYGASSKRYPQCVEANCNGQPVRKQSTAKKLRKKAKPVNRRVIRNWRGDVLIRRIN